MAENSRQTPEVLLIEPSRLHKEVILNHIRLSGLDAVFANNEIEAVSHIKENAFELIVCAVELEKQKGYDFAKQIRELIGGNIPILLLASTNDKKLLNTAFSSGVTEVIQRNHLISLQTYFKQIKDSKESARMGIGKILCVEDSKPISDLIKCVLEEQGHEVETLATAEEALERFKSEAEFDLLITDILLEGKMTGIGLAREIRQIDGKTGRMPILAISGLDNVDQRIEALRQGATDFVSKPINFEELDVRAKNLITAKKLYDKVLAQEQELRKMAVTDPLTGLYNRHYLTDVGLKRVEEAKRHQQDLSLIIVDIDHFKKVNDTHGHATGDDVLRAVGDLLKKSCRSEDFAVRFGGEEFVLVLPHCELDDGISKAERLREAIKALNPCNISITSSFGVASFSGSSDSNSLQIDSFNELFKYADEAVYLSKENGRDKVTSMTQVN